jgi:rhodanese-related sulfurtransferase
MSRFFKITLALVLAMFATTTLTACATSEHVHMDNVTAVIDVRTASEYASGHLQGAVNIDVEAPDFSSKVGTLDHAGDYVIYCHSGRRAGIAITNMESLGFAGTLTNAGGIDEASSSTGLPIVQ